VIELAENNFVVLLFSWYFHENIYPDWNMFKCIL